MRIILADDDPMMRGLLEAVLRHEGNEVEAYENGADAWEAFAANPAPMIVLDWQMPQVDGLELCRRVRGHAEGERTYLLMITAQAHPEDLEKVLDAGADDYISKPVSPADVLARLRIAVKRMVVAESRRGAEVALRKARYLAGVGELSLALQHEINNPLAALMTTLALITNGMLEEHEIPDSLKTIEQQAQRIAEVLRRLRDIKEEKSVEYAHGQRMVDLRGDQSR